MNGTVLPSGLSAGGNVVILTEYEIPMGTP